MKKIIFCDIDGVLNSAYYTKRDGGGISFIEERKVKNLKKIVDATGAEVVITSRANAIFGKTFNQARIDGIKEYGVTPIDSVTSMEFQDSKAIHIKLWLQKHNLENVPFVVIDDCQGDLEMQFRDKFIHVKGKHGLTTQHVRKAIEILNK